MQEIVIVTRVGSWVGAETTVELLRRNIAVLGIGTNAQRIATLHAALQRQLPATKSSLFIPCVGPLTSTATQQSILDHLQQYRLLAMINNTGAYEEDEPGVISGKSPFEQWDSLQRSLVDPLVLFHRIRHILRRNKCRVVNVASDDARSEMPRHVSLIAIKTAVNLITAEIAVVDPEVVSLAVHPAAPAVRLPPQERREVKPEEDGKPPPPAAADLIVGLALSADPSLSGQYFMYSEPEFLVHPPPEP
ncbi:hypothetical protein GGI15_003676 [Coemansia interrupta]|uniref:Uncharacterized protein n=1 Tax=Coemansia interrupta TaxID=1126814 RepID=A0A9W8LI17_9FUNG|nr:hypothetical protein GGI15_003676 [Coemansia interrupta]